MEEMWKEIKGYEGYYEVSNMGRVRSMDRYVERSDGVIQHRRSHIKAQNDSTDGYSTVKLSKGGVDKRIGVHILVADAFIEGKRDGYEVNHIDFDRKNNLYTNLEWVTHAENVQKSIDAGRHVCCTDLTGSNNPNYGNHTLSEKYLDKELAKQKQSRPGRTNGRAQKVMANIGGDCKLFEYIGECARYMIDNCLCASKSVNSVTAYISNAARTGKMYYGYTFSLV